LVSWYRRSFFFFHDIFRLHIEGHMQNDKIITINCMEARCDYHLKQCYLRSLDAVKIYFEEWCCRSCDTITIIVFLFIPHVTLLHIHIIYCVDPCFMLYVGVF
jgi:hypothetical protein